MTWIKTNTKVDTLVDTIRPLDTYLQGKDSILRNISGIYSFWWINKDASVLEKLYRNTKLKGKKLVDSHQLHDVHWNWNTDKPLICLYAGKATCIQTRMDQHLELSTSSTDWYKKEYKVYRKQQSRTILPDILLDFLVKRTTACQFRAGLEHLFKQSPGELAEKLQHIGFAFIEEKDPVERFYLEDLAIGVYRPWFNVDVER
jgi:hypothetical protein